MSDPGGDLNDTIAWFKETVLSPPTRKDRLMAEEAKKVGTQYVVLAKTKDGHWEELGVIRATSDHSAKRKVLAQHKPEGAEVVAVPSRSWKVEDLKPEVRFV